MDVFWHRHPIHSCIQMLFLMKRVGAPFILPGSCSCPHILSRIQDLWHGRTIGQSSASIDEFKSGKVQDLVYILWLFTITKSPMSRRFASYWVRWSKRAAQLLRASFKRSCHGESTIQECWKRKERPWTCCRGRSTMKVMRSMMTERKWRSEPRVADGLHFGNFYPQRQVSEWDTCTRWLSFGFVFFSWTTVRIHVKLTGFTSRYFGLASNGLLRFAFAVPHWMWCRRDFSPMCWQKGQQERSKTPPAWSV